MTIYEQKWISELHNKIDT